MGSSSREGEVRASLLERIHRRFEVPMIFLGAAWLLLLIIDFTSGLSRLLQTAFQTIWVLFIIDFLLEFIIAPGKLSYLKHNWLTALSLIVPALRIFRVFRAVAFLRAVSAARGVRLIGVIGSINRGMRALGKSLQKRGIGYIVLLTLIVVMAGAAGMYSFEKGITDDLSDFGSAVWWTAMIITTMGSGDWPKTTEGRILCFLLALYSFTIFGYIAAALASFFVGQDKDEASAAPAAAAVSLSEQITRLSKQLESLERKAKKDE